MNTDSGKGYTYQIGTQFYYVEICFYNGIKNPVFIPMNIVEELSIKENLNQWWATGYITLQNDFQFLEKGSTYKDKTGEKKSAENLMTDRPDGRNKFCVRLHPVNPNNKSENEFISENLKDFELCFDFVVYDVQDQPTDNAEKKFKTYYLWDERYQLFLERNLEWSTALIAKEMNNIQQFLSESDRQLNPNIAIKKLLEKAALYPDETPIKIGYLKNGSIDKPDQDAISIDNDNWNNGSDDNKIFYTSYASNNISDDIENVLPYCCDEKGFPVILNIGRSSEDKKFKLVSLKRYFDDSAKNQKERFVFYDTKDASLEKGKWVSRGPDFDKEPPNSLKNFTSGIASKVTSYQFCPMSNIDDRNLVSSPQHYFDFSTGEFNILFKDNTINDFENKVKEMVSGLHNLNSNNGQVLLKINKIKQQNSALKNVFSAVKEIPKNLPQIQMLKDFVFLNQALVFQTYGLTFRAPGNFFTLESVHSDEYQNDFWDKFLGQWMMVEVEHKFSKELYSNVIVANKVDSYSKIFEIKDEKYDA